MENKINLPEVNSERWLSMDNLDGEEWRPVVGYEDIYEVSSYGRVKRLPYNSNGKTIGRKKVFIRHYDGGILKGSVCKNGYRRVTLTKNGKNKFYHIHSIVAQAFISNPRRFPCINHKNEDKTDNRVENLEYCSYKYNNEYNGCKERARRTRISKVGRPCRATNIKDGSVRIFPSLSDAWRALGFNKYHIYDVVRKVRKTCNGYIIDYID